MFALFFPNESRPVVLPRGKGSASRTTMGFDAIPFFEEGLTPPLPPPSACWLSSSSVLLSATPELGGLLRPRCMNFMPLSLLENFFFVEEAMAPLVGPYPPPPPRAPAGATAPASHAIDRSIVTRGGSI